MSNDPLHRDLKISRRIFDRMTSDRQYVDLELAASGDLATVSGRENLAQAIINRLLTRRGDLAALGHPDYGSRLHTLIGELNNVRLRGRAELYIRECLAQEPRIAEIVRIAFAAPDRHDTRSDLQVEITIKPIPVPGEDERNLSIFLPLNTGTSLWPLNRKNSTIS